MQQIVDLQTDKVFLELDVALLSIAFDPMEVLAEVGGQYGTMIPLLTDADHQVSEAYGVLQWAVASGEPGHTFVLVNTDGAVAWIQDYGAEENRGVMYVDPKEISGNVRSSLGG